MFIQSHSAVMLLNNPRFGIKKFFKKILRWYIDKIDDEAQDKSLIPETKKIPLNMEQKQQEMHMKQRSLAEMQRQQLQALDQMLTTNTHFHDLKYYQKRLDSQHILEISRIKRKSMADLLKNLINRPDPQQQTDTRIRNRKIHNLKLINEREYPRHPQTIDLQDYNSDKSLQFLSKEVIYSRMSFQDVYTVKQSFLAEQTLDRPEVLLSDNYAYYKKQHQVYRTKKSNYQNNPLLVDLVDVFEVISLDEIEAVLKNYEEDARVDNYLKYLENGRLGSIMEKLIYNQSERYVGVVIDLNNANTDIPAEYCLILKDLVTGIVFKNVLFDISPDPVLFNTEVIFIKKDINNKMTEVESFNLVDHTSTHLYKQNSQFQLNLVLDPSHLIVYLYRGHDSIVPVHKVMMYGFEGSNKFENLLDRADSQYKVYYIADKGFVYCKLFMNFEKKANFKIPVIADQLFLIPFASETGVTTITSERNLQKQQHLKEFIKQYNIYSDQKIELPVKKKIRKLSDTHQSLYKCQPYEYIQNITNLKSHVVLNLIDSWACQQQRNQMHSRLKFFSNKQACSTSQLLIKQQELELSQMQEYSSQKVRFNTRNLLRTEYCYTIWKKQLSQVHPNQIFCQNIQFNSRDAYPLSFKAYCHKRYIDKNIISVIFVPSGDQVINPQVLDALLHKGVLVVVFQGRGSLTGTKRLFEDGQGCNRHHNVNDLIDTALYMIQANISNNISVYSKGPVAGYTALMANIIQPQLFTATAIYNGLFDIQQSYLHKDLLVQQSFGFLFDEEAQAYWAKHNILKLPFFYHNQLPQKDTRYIEKLDNILITCNSSEAYESRKLIHHLRTKCKRTLDEVYYEEAHNELEADLNNISYLFRNLVNNSNL